MFEAPTFRINNSALFARIEELKKHPTPDILEFKALHPEYKTVNCTLLAAYAGVSESTLKNLKLGKITDCNCSTVFLICVKLGLDLYDMFGLPKPAICDPASCTSNSIALLDEKNRHIADLEAQHKDADARILDMYEQLGIAKAKAESIELILHEKENSIDKLNCEMRKRNITIIGLFALLLVAISLFAFCK